MKKILLIVFLFIVAAIIAYVTFVISALEITVGAILLGISLICLVIVAILWKVRD